MKAIDTEMRENLKKWANLSNRDAIEGVLSCTVCLMLVSVFGIANSLGTILYLLFRSYFAVFISTIGIRYILEYVEYRFEFFVLIILIAVFIIESGYIIVDEFIGMIF